MTTRPALLAALAGSALAPAALAQDVLSTVRIAQGDLSTQYGEVAVIASPLLYNEAAVAFLRHSPTTVYIVTTQDAFDRFTSPVELAVPSGACTDSVSVDPFVAASAETGDVLVGGYSFKSAVLQRKPLGRGELSDPVVAFACVRDPLDESALGVDKPFAAIGPWPTPHNTPEVMHIGYVSSPAAFDGFASAAYAVHSKDQGDAGMYWPDQSEAGYSNFIAAETDADDTHTGAITHGDGAYPLVVPRGAHAGRVIVAFDQRSQTERFVPAVTWTDTAGEATTGRRWALKQELATFGPSGQEQNIYPDSFDTPFPSAALDPVDANTVYVAFVATAGGEETDIFVAQGITSETTGALVFAAARTVRISDDMLRFNAVDEGPTWESKVSIVVDSQQGINLLYSRWARALDGKMVVRYARWESFDSLANHDAALVRSLSGPFDPWPTGTGHFDYQMMCLAGCRLYAAYPTSESGTWDEYVSVIRLNTFRCQPDPECWANCDGSTQSPILNALDFTCFLQRYAEGAAFPYTVQLTNYANCDHSTVAPVLNVNDFSCFIQKYAAGCVQ